MLLSFKFLFSFLKKRHVSDGAEAYFRLFWEMMLVSLDSNQPGRGDVSNRVQAWISEAESDSDLCPEARHNGSQDVCKGELVALGLCRDTTKMQGELPFLWLCPLGLSNLQGKKKKFWVGKKKTKQLFLKDRSGLNANLRQLLMGSNNIKDLLSLPAPPPPPPPLKEL